ncbi:nucleoprotein/polynucleotide-associated enzyme [Methylophaga sp. 42_8_T64]|nr:nucleoprotein/polynucleotide-associated enzyme [Methylophaga sp. 41_12_T18]OUR88257.1 nucleoprotein/polynucleotide-associated enzyme [Methylophaga sp. 42_8_T64]
MAGSLQDQLLNIGVIDKKKAKKSQHQKRKDGNKVRQAAKSGQKVESQNQANQQIAQAQRDKQQRDRELNKQRDAEQAKKALLAEVKQIVQQHAVTIPKEAELAYNFTHDKKVKKIYVTNELQSQLALGQLALVITSDATTLVPSKVAAKIEARLPEMVVRSTQDAESVENDPYADYQIPDDLMW